jgi:spore coat protein CotH
MSRFILALFSIISGAALFAQNNLPDFGPAFVQNEVASVYINMDPDSLLAMLAEENIYSGHIYPAEFIYNSNALNDTIGLVGFRLRGNTSLNSAKKSFFVAFNEFDNNKWQQLEKMNLVGLQNDPSLIRSKICHDTYRQIGIPCARTSFVRLYINNEYRGLYQNQEQIDEQFAKKYFDNQGNGNLFKCTYPADLDFIGSNPDVYKLDNGNGKRVYELQTNEWDDNYQFLGHFIDAINNTSLNTFECEVSKVIDIENYLKVAVVDILTSNWDGYIFNKNNYYLYQDQQSGLFQFIPYDLDNTMGIDWFGEDWPSRNIYNWAPSGTDRPLFKRVMQIPAFRNRFSELFQDMITQYFTVENISSIASTWQQLIMDAALEDNYRTLDYGFTADDFLNAIDMAWGGQVDYGIAEYVSLRVANAAAQIEPFDSTKVNIHWVNNQFELNGESAITHIRAHIEGDFANACVLQFSHDGITFTDIEGFSDVNAFDANQDHLFTYYNTIPWSQDSLFYRIIYTEITDTIFFPCNDKLIWFTPSSSPLFINEAMKDNTTTIADEFGGYPAWIELWNQGPQALNLSQYYLTDDSTDFNKWHLPAITLNAGDFILLWLDNDPEQGQKHSPFKWSDNELSVWLCDIERSAVRLVDHFGNITLQNQELSYERITDGNNTIALTNTPTPGYSNNPVSIAELSQNISVFPNPTEGLIRFSALTKNLSIFDSSGNLVSKLNHIRQLDLSSYHSGVYTLVADGKYIKLVVVH